MSDTVAFDPMEQDAIDPDPATGPDPEYVGMALRNAMTLLQTDPTAYRRFGVWWWPIKRLLKRDGYTTDNLAALGDYFDPESAALVPREGLFETLGSAFEEYAFNARFPRANGMVEAPSGEIVRIWDQDAGL